jgi:hypothetical protein
MMPVINAPDARLSTVRAASAQAPVTRTSGFLMAMFLIVLLIPVNMDIAGLRLSPYRVYLLALFLPFAARLVTGGAGRVTLSDLGMFGYGSLMVVTLVYHHGVERLPYALILAVEMFGSYMTGRILIRNLADYQRFIRYFLWMLLLLAPLAIYELFYSRMPLSDLFGTIFSVTTKNQEFRLGLSRVQVAFPHSILYGLFCSLALASTYYLYRHRLMQALPRMALVIGMTLMSLSSAPMLSVLLQVLLIAWDKITRSRWRLLVVLGVLAYGFVQIFSNRGAVVIFIETMTLDPATGWWRIYIWRFGSASVLAHPLMGIGLNDWVRPFWLTSSVDNFWLLMAMRHGLPCLACLLIAIALHIRSVLRVSDLSPDQQAARTGYMVTLVGLIFTLATVHVWNELAVFVMFYFGAGSFLYTSAPAADPAGPGEAEPATNSRRALPYSRFPTGSGTDPSRPRQTAEPKSQ